MIIDDRLYQKAIDTVVTLLTGEAGFAAPTAVTGYSEGNVLIAWQAAMRLGLSVPRDPLPDRADAGEGAVYGLHPDGVSKPMV